MMADNTQRFSNRAEDYARFRPRYPQAVLNILENECGLSTHHKIADIGSGTGILTELFLKNKNLVYGVEPNKAMRTAAVMLLQPYSWFISVDGTAEATTLRDRSVEWITAGQAFHWFDREKARREFLRILKPKGWVCLVSNNRQRTTAFMRAYERLLVQLGRAYQESNHQRIPPDAFADFFGSTGYKTTAIENHQDLDWEGLEGRLASSSYAPERGTPAFAPMIDELKTIFQAHQQNGRVRMDYLTTMHYGRLS
jgi:SAM-dependent methyltransferase